MYPSRSWLSDNLRSNLCEDAVGRSTCQTSEYPPSTYFGEKRDLESIIDNNVASTSSEA